MMSRFCSRPSTWYLPAAARSNRTTVPARIRLASARGVSRKRHFSGSFPSSSPDGPASRKAAFSGQPQNQIKNAKTGSALCRPRFGWYRKIREWLCIPALGNTAQFAPFGLSTAATDLRAKSRRKRRLRSEAPRCGSVCEAQSALQKCSVMSGCGTRIVLRGQKPLALCDRCPCFGSLYPPLAALTFAASSITCAFCLAVCTSRSLHRHLELCGIALTRFCGICGRRSLRTPPTPQCSRRGRPGAPDTCQS